MLTTAICLPTPAIGVAGVIFNQADEVLLIRRKYPPSAGLWSIPGGKQEAGESLVAACEREVLEETGLCVHAKHIVAVVERCDAHFHYVIIDFLAQLVEGQDHTPVAKSDVTEACWVAVTKLHEYPLVEGLQRIILSARDPEQRGRTGLHDLDALSKDFVQAY